MLQHEDDEKWLQNNCFVKVNVNDTVLASVLEEYYHYAYLFEEELEEEIRKMDFAERKDVFDVFIRQTLNMFAGTFS